MKTDVKGRSTCAAGREQYEVSQPRPQKKFGLHLAAPRMNFRVLRYVQYDYRTLDGELFSTTAPTLAAARARRDEWLAGLKQLKQAA
jgi:hypothetical protein